MDFANEQEIKYAHDILLQSLPDFDKEKIDIIKCNESRDIKACPGSGKTTTLLAKLVILAKRMPFPDGKGICVLTHTNVAIDEIKSKLDSLADVLFNYPNYFGTIQGFVDKFLTIPYYNSVEENLLAAIDDDRAYSLFLKKFSSLPQGDLNGLLMRIKDRIPGNLHGKERQDRIKKEQQDFLFNVFYDVDSKAYYKRYGENKALVRDKSKSLFQLLEGTRGAGLKEGILKYKDAYSYALAYANQCDNLKSALSERFSYLFIDEMQDTDELQYDLINKLFDPSKIIVQRFGDPYQSIFEHGKMKWTPNHEFLPLSMSNRFGNRIAALLKTVCESNNESIIGNESIHSLKPIMIVYNDPETVLPYFAKLVKERDIEGEKILEISNRLRGTDILSRCNIKAIGWVGKESTVGISIKSYYPPFERKRKATDSHEKTTLCDYLRKTESFSTKVYSDQIFTALASILELSNINYSSNGKQLRYTKSRVQSFMKDKYPEEYRQLRSNIARWAIESFNSQSPIDIDVYNQIRAYITKDFRKMFGFNDQLPEYSSFMTYPGEKFNDEVNTNNVRQNIYVKDGVEIEVATVHSVKGETHVATLYMETTYKDKCESQRIGDQLCGIPYSKAAAYTTMSLRIAYVAMSRPRYMLCMAIKKENYDNLDHAQLSELWETLEI